VSRTFGTGPGAGASWYTCTVGKLGGSTAAARCLPSGDHASDLTEPSNTKSRITGFLVPTSTRPMRWWVAPPVAQAMERPSGARPKAANVVASTPKAFGSSRLVSGFQRLGSVRTSRTGVVDCPATKARTPLACATLTFCKAKTPSAPPPAANLIANFASSASAVSWPSAVRLRPAVGTVGAAKTSLPARSMVSVTLPNSGLPLRSNLAPVSS